MIKGFDENNIGNPIRKHISIEFQKADDRTNMLEKIMNDLKNKFNESKSTVLIFVPTRKGTEEVSRELNEIFEENKLENLHNKIDFFHAGMDSMEREEKYLNFKNGKLLILVATKAFGMGMDIPNIHYVYHISPSSTFEDFLQEVGRAGRNKTMLLDAGFSKENPISTKCLYTAQDFNYLREKLHKNEITWTQLGKVRDSVFDYIKEFRPIVEKDKNAFPLPLDLLENLPEFKDKFNRETFFRVCLYWLEKLGRIRLGVFTPSFLPIRLLEEGHNFISIKTEAERNKLIQLYQKLVTYKSNNFPKADIITISVNQLKEFVEINNTAELFIVLFTAQRCKLIVVEREIALEPTKLRIAEINDNSKHLEYPIINATFLLAREILSNTVLGNQRLFEPDELDIIVQPLIENQFVPSKFNWIEQKGSNGKENYTRKELAVRARDDFKGRRAKFAFKILSFIPKLKHKSIITFEKGYEKSTTTHLIFNNGTSIENQINYLIMFSRDLINLISTVSKSFIDKKQSTFNIINLINDLGIDEKGEEYFKNLLFIAKGLGYLKGEGTLVPMGIELFIEKITALEDNIEDNIIKDEFLATGKMKQLRLLALECLSERPRLEQDKFIRSFFKCGTVEDLLSLLEENFEENSPKLQAYREEALNREIKGLNPDQKKVYEMAIEKHIQVIAGPGSGKTFTLILRIARLIQEERVNPETILVLAYNRAVVVELKERLSKLFKELGYSKLISRLKVFTFHGFAKYCLGNQINDLKFDDWTPEFIRIMTNSPGLINQKLGTIKYVFVDEFQDITSERLKLINFIANPQETKICVIGDPNQSIYGYQRDQQNEPMEPKPYYDDFKNIYNPEELNLSINYRSYPLILKEAETILALNESKFPMPKLVPHLSPKTDEVYCEIVDLVQSQLDWKVKVKDFLDYRDIDDEKYRQIAVMFRSNDEVYRAYNLLKNEKIPNVKIRIQGAKGSLLKTREFYHSLTLYKQCLDDKLQDNYVAVYENNKKKILSKYKNWEEYFLDIFHCLLIEFENDREEESTYENLCEFIAEISAKDDGQLAKIYDKNIGRIKQDAIKQEIIITTMHKVKGVEYDSVIIPASLSNLPQKPVSVDKIKSYIEEERRVYYVAYTRAKKRLLAIKYDRENAIDNGTNFTFNTQLIKKKYGFKVEEGIDKFTMFWSASPNGGISFNHIRDKVKIGDAIEIKEFMEGFFVLHNEVRIAKISNTMSKKMKDMQQMKGFVVSSVYVNTYDETLMSDENSKKDFDVKKHTNYALNWTTEAKERGYIYLIDFSGYGN